MAEMHSHEDQQRSWPGPLTLSMAHSAAPEQAESSTSQDALGSDAEEPPATASSEQQQLPMPLPRTQQIYYPPMPSTPAFYQSTSTTFSTSFSSAPPPRTAPGYAMPDYGPRSAPLPMPAGMMPSNYHSRFDSPYAYGPYRMPGTPRSQSLSPTFAPHSSSLYTSPYTRPASELSPRSSVPPTPQLPMPMRSLPPPLPNVPPPMPAISPMTPRHSLSQRQPPQAQAVSMVKPKPFQMPPGRHPSVMRPLSPLDARTFEHEREYGYQEPQEQEQEEDQPEFDEPEDQPAEPERSSTPPPAPARAPVVSREADPITTEEQQQMNAGQGAVRALVGFIAKEPRSLQPFVNKLLHLLSCEKYRPYIRWNTPGDAFILSHTNAHFAEKILPLLFRHSNTSSFIRQLNMYGFTRLPLSQLLDMIDGGSHLDTSISTACFSAFSHEHLRRDRPEMSKLIKPRVVRTHASRKASAAARKLRQERGEPEPPRRRPGKLQAEQAAAQQQDFTPQLSHVGQYGQVAYPSVMQAANSRPTKRSTSSARSRAPQTMSEDEDAEWEPMGGDDDDYLP